MNLVNVVEKEVMLPYLVSSFDMNVIIVSLGHSATVISNTYDNIGNKLYEKQFLIEGSEYSNWGTDDYYLKNLIAGKLGLEIKTELARNIEITFDEL